MPEKDLSPLVDGSTAWGAVDWWRLELRGFADAPYVQSALARLAPKEAVSAERPRITAGSCLQGLAYLFLLAGPLIGAVAMLRWAIGGSAFDFPLAFAGMLTLLGLPVVAWSRFQAHRRPRAVARSAQRTNTLMHVIPGVATALIALTVGAPLLTAESWIWLTVIFVDVLVSTVLFLRGNVIKGGPQNPHDNVDQSISEVDPQVLERILAQRNAAIQRLLERDKVDAATAERARATRPGWLALTMAPEVGSDYFRPPAD